MKNLTSLLAKNNWVKYALFIGGGLVVLLIIKNFFKGKSLSKLILGDVANSAQAAGVTAAAVGLESVRSAAVIDICEKIYKAFYKHDWFGFSEDEEAAQLAFNQLLNITEAKAAVRIYQANYGKSLYGDLSSYIHGSTWDGLKSYLINAIKE